MSAHPPLSGGHVTPAADPEVAALLLAALDRADVAVSLQDAQGRYVYANAAWHRLSGVAADPIGSTSEELLGGALAAAVTHHERQVRDAGLPLAARELLSGDNGLKTHLTVRFPAGAEGSGLLGAFSADVSSTLSRTEELFEQNQALASQVVGLERSNRDLTDFAHVASHDLAEPLRAVSGYVQLLSRRYGEDLDEKGQRWISHAVEGVDRMAGLIQDLLAYSRVGGEELRRAAVDTDALLAEVVQGLSDAVAASGGRILVDPLPVVSGDVAQLRQLLHNLVGNALKFGAEGRPVVVHIGADALADGWCFRVSDNGIGIPPEHRERIFRMFQRLHLREEYPGSGIGLAIAQRIVEQHGGTISVSDGGYGGACFTFTLPAAPTDAGGAQGTGNAR